MRITQSLQKELALWLDNYWKTYLKGDLETWSTFIKDDYYNIGGTKEEIWHSKQEILDYSRAMSEQMIGQAELRNRKVEASAYGEFIMLNEFTDMYVKAGKEWVFYGHFRMSSLMEKTKNGWIVQHQHGSFPDMKAAEGEAFGLDAIKAENERLKKAVEERTAELELQKKELEIEAALERVRAVAMGMKSPEDMLKVCREISDQLIQLGVTEIRNIQTAIVEQDKGIYRCYQYFTPYDQSTIEDTEYLKNRVEQAMISQMLQAKDSHFTGKMEGKDLAEFRNHRKEENHFPDPLLDQTETLSYCFLSIGEGGLGLTIYRTLDQETLGLFKRFHQVFSLAYQRFRDIQKAEAQAREAQIEVAVERVRARTMAMQHSDELAEASLLLDQQVRGLGIATRGCAFHIYGKNDSSEWFSSEQGTMPVYHTPRENVFLEYFEAGQRGETLYVKEFAGEACIKHYDYLCSLPVMGDGLKEFVKAGGKFPERQVDHATFFKYGYLLFITLDSVPEAHDIFKRFAKVFEQTYTRFLDLQKAEEQAREAQIEAALERVRSRSMGMHKSEELQDVIQVVYQQLTNLAINLDHAGFVVDYTPKGDWHFWIADDNDVPSKITHPYFESVWSTQFNEAKKTGAKSFVTLLNFEEKNKFYEELLSFVPGLSQASKDFYLKSQGFAATTVVFDEVSLYMENFEGKPYSEEENNILYRFGKVFQQAYTRFLDLQKAEARAREAQIEAALEKVRSRSLAMQTSSELQYVVKIIAEKLQELGVVVDPSGVMITTYKPNSKDLIHWTYSPDEDRSIPFFIPYFKDPIVDDHWESKNSGVDFFSKTYSQEVANNFQKIIFTHPQSGYRHLNQKYKDWVLSCKKYTVSHAWQKNSALLIPNHFGIAPTEAQKNILIRFARVFEQSYIRFLDLQKAEAQAREAQIELSLERIRAKVTSMQESTDLLDIMVSMRHEFVSLAYEAHYFWYMRWLPEKYEKAMTSGDGTKVGMVMSLPRHIHGDIPLVADWEKGNDPTLIFPMEVETAVDYVHKMISLGDFEVVDPQAPTLDDIRHIGGLTFIMARTSQGEIGYSLPGYVPDPPTEAVATLARFAGVFDLAYKRFEDLKKAERDLIEIKEAKKKAEEALSELKAAQSQLIQSEKMASLGELTAGIAHEIQNPLNFVNNFSEVSGELIDEAQEEIEKGDLEEIKFILQDLKDNLSKINHHGKRAGSIVKGMLEHSRKSEGKKEPVNLNLLADECLKLGVHGLRAKDKSFSADFKTNFAKDLPEVSIVRQDIGRVLLNLINNAFYAVHDFGKTQNKEYKPTVTVSTAQVKDQIEITVTDNGKGIPEQIQDKIFQPFFTTKPTGEGTGLGLSLSYDIVNAHGGKLTARNSPCGGAEFTITLPTNSISHG
jgi:signal transduction histidine kinase